MKILLKNFAVFTGECHIRVPIWKNKINSFRILIIKKVRYELERASSPVFIIVSPRYLYWNQNRDHLSNHRM